MPASITPQQRKTYSKLGKRLIKKRLTSGFQLEDYGPEQGRRVTYANDDPDNVRTVQRQIGGKIYPRESYYGWNPKWDKGPNTRLLYNKTLAREDAEYISSKDAKTKRRYLERRAFRRGKGFIPGSWIVPDIRIYGATSGTPGYKNAYLVTKRIDDDSRFSTIVTKKRKMEQLRKQMKYERVRRIRVQDKYGRTHSLWYFIDSF